MSSLRSVVFVVALTSVGSTAALASVQSGPIEPQVTINFQDIPTGTPANQLQIGIVSFSFGNETGISAGDRGIPGAFVSDNFPTTPNTNGKGILGSPFGRLGLTFARPVTGLSFGFGLHAADGSVFPGGGSVRDAVVVDLFNPEGGFIGSFSQNGTGFTPDDFGLTADRGGGAEYNTGLFATTTNLRIGSATVRFATEGVPPSEFPRGGNNGIPIDQFFFDNLSFIPAIVPLPTPAFLAASGLVALAAQRRRRGL